MAGKVEVLDSENFDKKTKEGNWVIDFWAEWCGPCKVLGPRFAEASEELKEKVNFGKVDVDAETDLAQKFGVMSIPSIVFIKDGEMVDKIVGLMSKEAIIERASDNF